MNAMMSTDTRRYDGHGDAAMREARRILNVAEPRGTDPGLVRRYPPRPYETETFYVLNGFAAHDPDPWSIMAESLASFVSAPDPAAYLAARVAR